jgi:type I restriction enzyme S subunit
MKAGWQNKKLGELADVIAGQSPDGSCYNSDGQGMPFYQGKKEFGDKFIGEPTTWTTQVTRIATEGDVLMSVRAPVGPVNFATRELCIGRGLAAIRSRTQLDRDFLFNFLLSKRDEIEGTEGAVFASINKSQIEQIEIPYPPLSEQRRIVGILDEAFEGLATAKANAEQNLQNARALFESHLQAVFTQRGPGWKMEKLDTLTDLARGHNPPKSKFSREQKPGYIRFYQIRDGGTDDYAVYVPDTPQLHKMKKDDIMMVAYRHVGRAFRGVEGAFNVALCKISNARRDLLDDDYLFHMIPSPFVKGELLKRSERSLIPSMSIEHLRELKIPLPPLSEQQSIVKLINSLSTATQRLESLYQRKLAALDELKKSLLHRAFSGEL